MSCTAHTMRRRSCRFVTWCAMWCLALAVPVAVHAQAAVASVEAASEPAQAAVEAPALPLATRIEALETLASGALPKVPLEQLLEVSLDDDSSMVARDDALRRARRDTLVASRQARRLNVKSEAELAEMEAQILAIDLERKVLALPIEVRERLVSLDASRDDASEPGAPAVQAGQGPADRVERSDATPNVPAQSNAKTPAAQAVKSAPARGPAFVLLRFSWLAILLVGLWLVRRRTSDICDAYLAVRSEGALAASVRAYRERWFGFAPALVACAALVPSMLARGPQRLVLVRSRGTPAAGSEKRVEPAADYGSSIPGAASELPAPVRDALTLEPLRTESPLLVEHLPGLDVLRERFEAFRARARAHATLVVGRAGFGKTTWLYAAARAAEGVPVSYLSLRTRTTDPAVVRAELARAAGLSEKAADSTEALSQALLKAPRRVMCIDDLQHWFLRRPSGVEALRELERVIVASGSHVCWLASMSQYAHDFVEWATRSSGAFDHVVKLRPWSVADIEQLLSRRIAQAGVQVSYEQVVLEGLGRVSGSLRDYSRAICADVHGSPRAALERALACLHPQGDKAVQMRLSRAVSALELENASEVARFVLASAACHDGIGFAHLAETLRVSIDELRLEVDKLRALSVLVEHEGELAIATPWWPAVTRLLQRQHLVRGEELA